MATIIEDTTWRVVCTGPEDANLFMEITINRTNNAVAGITDFQIVDFIRDQLAIHTALPVSIEKRDVVLTTED